MQPRGLIRHLKYTRERWYIHRVYPSWLKRAALALFLPCFLRWYASFIDIRNGSFLRLLQWVDLLESGGKVYVVWQADLTVHIGIDRLHACTHEWQHSDHMRASRYTSKQPTSQGGYVVHCIIFRWPLRRFRVEIPTGIKVSHSNNRTVVSTWYRTGMLIAAAGLWCDVVW